MGDFHIHDLQLTDQQISMSLAIYDWTLYADGAHLPKMFRNLCFIVRLSLKLELQGTLSIYVNWD